MIAASTSLPEEIAVRVKRIAETQTSSEAAVIRRCVLEALPGLEAVILGPEFAGQPVAVSAKQEVVS